MLKRFINGLVFGSGFAVAFFIVSILGMQVYARYQLDSLEIELASRGLPLIVGSEDREEGVVDEPPAFVPESERFLGTQGSYSEGFTDINDKVLASGPGTIRGKITANGVPAAGLKLRLALNKAVMSQWGVSGSDGVYSIPVPYGKYIIGGYELDYDSANRALAGLIDVPDSSCDSGEFVVDADHPGEGLNLGYVDPVIKLTKGVTYTPTDDMVLSWQQYPGAQSYTVQLVEKQGATDYRFEHLFDWRGVEVVNATVLELAPYREKLKPGRYYSYQVNAVAADGKMLSESDFDVRGYDFRLE